MAAKALDGLVEDALRSFLAWKDASRLARRQLLQAWAEQLALVKDELARLVTQETGKPIALARGEVARA